MLGGLERRRGDGFTSLAAHVAHGPIAQELAPKTSDAVIPLGVTMADDHDLGALRKIRSYPLREPKRVAASCAPDTNSVGTEDFGGVRSVGAATFGK